MGDCAIDRLTPARVWLKHLLLDQIEFFRD
jgi:hypothetical protein